MRRVAPTVPIPPKVFRHFAMITLAITFGVAIFADGENRQAIDDELAERKASRELAKAEFDKFGPKKIGKPMRIKTKGAFGADTGFRSSDFGAPSDEFDYYDSSGVAFEDEAEPEQQPPAIPEVVPLDDAGNPVGQGTAKPAPRRAPPRRPSQEELERLLAASQIRSGNSGDEF